MPFAAAHPPSAPSHRHPGLGQLEAASYCCWKLDALPAAARRTTYGSRTRLQRPVILSWLALLLPFLAIMLSEHEEEVEARRRERRNPALGPGDECGVGRTPRARGVATASFSSTAAALGRREELD